MTDGIQVDVRRTGKRFDAEAVLELAADPQTVWDTITDYPALPRFLPGIRACRVTGREPLAGGGERLTVEQQGEFRFLLFAQAIACGWTSSTSRCAWRMPGPRVASWGC